MNKNSIIVLCESPIFNPTVVNLFPNLNIQYSVYLNTLLISNWIETFTRSDNFNIVLIINKADEEFIPHSLIPGNYKIIFYNGLEGIGNLASLLNEGNDNNAKILLLYYNSIGLKESDIQRTFELVNQEEASIAVGKSNKDKLIFNCSFANDHELIDSFLNAKRDFKIYLNKISNGDFFIHAMDRFYSIDDFEDIKKLYIELSKKESLAYCSQKMHENFNDLFIEYKDLLND